MTILITGGTGFLGSYLMRYALTMGGEDHVVVLDRYMERGRIADLLDRVTLIEGDVADPATVEAAIANHGVKRVAHFAFILGSPAPDQMLPYVRVQTLGTATVLESARKHGVERVLFASSVAAYGTQQADLLTEDLIPAPVEPYGASKAWGEALARHYTDSLGLDAVALRFGSTYGLGRAARGSYRSGMLPLPSSVHYMARVEAAARGQPIVMPGNDAMADWTYAADAAKAAWLALTAAELPHRLYNVGAERAPIGEFTQALRKLLPQAEISVSASELPGNAHKPMDSSRLRRDLGYTPDYSLEDGIADYLDRIRIFDGYERVAA
ncbi:MAG: NAD(P)-dependent oxidoreductase [Novosphingobium sp.]